MMQILGQVGWWIFVAALGLCAGGYFVYPLVVVILGAIRQRTAKPMHGARSQTELPTVTMLVAAYNERDVIAAKITNSLNLNYPRQRLQIRIVSDGSDDGTDEIVRGFASQEVELQRVSPRGGKPHAINQALPHARGDVLLLSDANTMLARGALRRLVRRLEDPDVGAVTGDVRLSSSGVNYGRGEGLFWKIERMTQLGESRLGCVVGVDGGMYVLRRELYVPNLPDTLIDDFVIAMNVARAGKRVLYEPRARATEDSPPQAMQEFRRRVRTVAGGFQSLLHGRGRPRWSQPMLWTGYFWHKAVRWFSPWLLTGALVGNMLAVLSERRATALAMLAVQAAFYALAAAGHLRHNGPMPAILSVPYYFLLSNLAAAAGLVRYLRGTQKVAWAKADRTPIAGGQS